MVLEEEHFQNEGTASTDALSVHSDLRSSKGIRREGAEGERGACVFSLLPLLVRLCPGNVLISILRISCSRRETRGPGNCND